MTWQEYWKREKWDRTVGKVPDKNGVYHPVDGRWNSAAPFTMGVPGTLPLVLGLPDTAVAQDTHGFGFIDPGVMDEWAQSHGIKIEPATQNDRDLGRFLSRDGATSFTVEVATWARDRKPSEGSGGVAEIAANHLGRVLEVAKDVAREQEKQAVSVEYLARQVGALTQQVRDITAAVAELKHAVNPTSGTVKRKGE